MKKVDILDYQKDRFNNLLIKKYIMTSLQTIRVDNGNIYHGQHLLAIVHSLEGQLKVHVFSQTVVMHRNSRQIRIVMPNGIHLHFSVRSGISIARESRKNWRDGSVSFTRDGTVRRMVQMQYRMHQINGYVFDLMEKEFLGWPVGEIIPEIKKIPESYYVVTMTFDQNLRPHLVSSEMPMSMSLPRMIEPVMVADAGTCQGIEEQVRLSEAAELYGDEIRALEKMLVGLKKRKHELEKDAEEAREENQEFWKSVKIRQAIAKKRQRAQMKTPEEMEQLEQERTYKRLSSRIQLLQRKIQKLEEKLERVQQVAHANLDREAEWRTDELVEIASSVDKLRRVFYRVQQNIINWEQQVRQLHGTPSSSIDEMAQNLKNVQKASTQVLLWKDKMRKVRKVYNASCTAQKTLLDGDARRQTFAEDIAELQQQLQGARQELDQVRLERDQMKGSKRRRRK